MTNIEFSDPANDAPCPSCGQLLWASTQLAEQLWQRCDEILDASPVERATDARIDELGIDSLETIELVMELEEQFDVSIPEEDAEGIHTVGDLLRYIQKRR